MAPADAGIRCTWDLATDVGVIATMVAAGRAVAAASGLVNDPFAAPLVRAVGVEFCTRVVDGELDLARLGADGGFPRMAELSAARTRFFDGFFAEAGRAGIRQAVILASGLDTRCYRLWWPAGTTLYEIDQPRVIEFKTVTMRTLGAAPNLNRRGVGIDLRHTWPAALRRVGFDTATPTAWLVHGLLIGFLSQAARDRLLDGVTELSAGGSRLSADYPMPPNQTQAAHGHAMVERWRRRGLDIDFAGVSYAGGHHDVAHALAARGWATEESSIVDLFAAARLPELCARDLDGTPAAIGYLSATRK